MTTMAMCFIGFVALLSILVTIVLIMRRDVLNLSRVIGQATSGRWLLTIASATCLLMMATTDAWFAVKFLSKDPTLKLPFDASTIFTLIGGVFTFYFLKPNDNGDAGGQNPPVPPVPPEK